MYSTILSSAGLLGCTYVSMQVAMQDYWDVQYLLSGAGGSAGLTGALGGATGLSNQAAEVAVIRCQINVRPELDALLK